MQNDIRLSRPWHLGLLQWWSGLSFQARLGLFFGIVMPVVSGLLFPTYIHHMPLKWEERARLLEWHFVVSETIVIAWAFARGLDRGQLWASLPKDIRIASAIFLGVMFFSSGVLATAPVDALLQSMIQLIHLYFFASVYHLARVYGPKDSEELLKWLFYGLPVLAAYTIWRFNFSPLLAEISPGKIEWDSALPGFINLRHLGTWTGAIAAGISVHVLYRTNFDSPRIMHALLVLTLAFMFWTATRGAVFGVLVAQAMCVITFRQLPPVKNLVWSAVLAVAALGLALVLEFDHPVFRFYNSGEMGDAGTFAAGRLELWAATYARWLESPLVGWGTGSVFTDVFVGWSHTQPHNSILQALVSWGLVGGLAAGWLVTRAFAAAAGVARNDSLERSSWPLLAVAYSLLAMSMLSGPFYYPRFIILTIIALAIVIAQGHACRARTSG